MEKDILNRIVEVEKEIEDKIENEKRKVEIWLNELRLKSEEDILIEDQKNKQILEQKIEAAKKDAEDKASLLINNAIKYAKNLDSISESVLKEILLRHISKILPLLL